MSALGVSASTPLRDFALEVDLAVGGAERLALVGASGAGKTTVLRVIAGLLTPAAGRVSRGEELWLDTAAGVDIAPERRRCGYVFQDYALFPGMSAWRNVAYGMRATPRRERRQRAGEMLERFGIGGLAEARSSELSGGERQRVAIARALSVYPPVLLADEPTGNLDTRTGEEILALIRDVHSRLGCTVVIVTHDMIVAQSCQRTIALRDGRVVEDVRR